MLLQEDFAITAQENFLSASFCTPDHGTRMAGSKIDHDNFATMLLSIKGLICPLSPHVEYCLNRPEIYLYTLQNSGFKSYLGFQLFTLFTTSGFQNPKLLGMLFQNVSQLIVPHISFFITQNTSVVTTPMAPQALSVSSISLSAWSVCKWSYSFCVQF